MSKFDDVVERCLKQMKEQQIDVDRELLESIAKSMGPSLYRRDAVLVATGQTSELTSIKKNYLVKKLGYKDGPILDEALTAAIEQIGPSRRNKLRPVFYYLLVQHLNAHQQELALSASEFAAIYEIDTERAITEVKLQRWYDAMESEHAS